MTDAHKHRRLPVCLCCLPSTRLVRFYVVFFPPLKGLTAADECISL